MLIVYAGSGINYIAYMPTQSALHQKLVLTINTLGWLEFECVVTGINTNKNDLVG